MFLLIILFLICLNIYFKKTLFKIDLFPYIIIILILYSGLKNEYSFDYENYIINFNEINSFADVVNTNFEKGYAFIVFFFKQLGFGFNTLLLFIAYLSIKMKANVINKTSVIPEVSLLIYFLVFYINNDVEQIRHGISIGLCFYSLNYMIKDDRKSNVIALLLIGLSLLFHMSAVVFIPFYLIKDKKIENKNLILFFLIAFLISFTNLFNVISFINDQFIQSSYLHSKLVIYSSSTQSIISNTLFIKIFILSLFYFYAYDTNNKIHRLMFNCYYSGILITCLFNSVPILVARGSIYYRYVEILLIPIYLNSIKEKRDKRIHYLFLLIIFTYYALKFYTTFKQPEYFYYASI